MAHDQPNREHEVLDLLIGEWIEQIRLPDAPAGRMTCEWILDHRYMLQRSDSPQPEFPDSMAVVADDENTNSFVQHYFDSRGVVRIYQMTLDEHSWTLQRHEPDFEDVPLRVEVRW